MVRVLGISCFYHDSAAALVEDGEIIAAAQEERFSRVKHDPRFPSHAINYCLEQARVHINEIDHLVYYDNIASSFERLADSALRMNHANVGLWQRYFGKFIRQKFNIFEITKNAIGWDREIICSEHHFSHAASAFYPSPFNDAAVLTIDGVGEWATASYGVGSGNQLRLLGEMRYPDSIGLLYSAFTHFCGFKVNSGEYKLMGLAPYGSPIYENLIFDKLVDLHADGSITLNQDYFCFDTSKEMTNQRFADCFGGGRREAESRLTKREMDIAASIQKVTEKIVLTMARHVQGMTEKKQLCLAGGVALNCVANGELLRQKIFDQIWIQPAAGDAGGALGAALGFYHSELDKPRAVPLNRRCLQDNSLFGPAFSNDEIKAFLHSNDYPFHYHESEKELTHRVAALMADGAIVGHFCGRMEFGPRALGARSILADSRSTSMQRDLNLKIKYRESFRPFAPMVLEEDVADYFEHTDPSPYMLLVASVNQSIRKEVPDLDQEDDLLQWVNQARSTIPAVTHVDYSARLQTIHKEEHPRIHALISEFKKMTDCSVIVNTSFNVRGEPIVCTPHDAYRCFQRTEMDVLVLENCILLKSEQPAWSETKDWRNEFVLD